MAQMGNPTLATHTLNKTRQPVPATSYSWTSRRCPSVTTTIKRIPSSIVYRTR
jgi:hypothetical protein